MKVLTVGTISSEDGHGRDSILISPSRNSGVTERTGCGREDKRRRDDPDQANMGREKSLLTPFANWGRKSEENSKESYAEGLFVHERSLSSYLFPSSNLFPFLPLLLPW